jgi:monoamine oxidase
VIVGGAGLSGLTAALLLEERGIETVVLEARERVGGRVVTLDRVPGSPEGGGPTIATSYRRLLRIAEAVGVTMGPAPPFDPGMLLIVAGQGVDVRGWAGSPANRTVGGERSVPPPQLLGYYMSKDIPLADAAAWVDPRYAALDVPLDAFLRSRGASDEALRLMDVSSNCETLAATSALWALRDAQRRRDGKGAQIVHANGGNGSIVNSMRSRLEGEVVTAKPITAVRSAADGVEVSTSDGTVFKGDYCILTLPLPVLREVAFDPPLAGAQLEAVRTVPYTAITKYYFTARRPFWDEDGLAPTMWTDSLIERVFAARDAQGAVESLTVWVDGAGAAELDAMPVTDQPARVLAEFERLRPAAKGALEFADMLSWGRDPCARGAYACYAPGQVSRLKPAMALPWQRVHFAGEHTAVTSPGMEGALESAERAVDEVLARYG